LVAVISRSYKETICGGEASPDKKEGAEMRNSGRTSIIAILLSILFMFSFTSSWAANIYVSATGTGTGTKASPANLQAALDKANSTAGSHILYLREGIYDAAAAGGFRLTAVGNATDKSIILSGGWNAAYTGQSADPGKTTLDGKTTSPVLIFLSDGGTVPLNVHVENLTVENGYIYGDNGAGIKADVLNGGFLNLYVRKTMIRNNVVRKNASNVGGHGGGLFITCYAEVSDTWFESNSSDYHGAAVNFSYRAPSYDKSVSPKVDHCTFLNNYNVGCCPGGSAVMNYVNLAVTNSHFEGQSGSGSPITSSYAGGYLSVSNSVFSNNGILYWGSGIQFWESGGEITNCVFWKNNAGLGTDGYGAITYYDNMKPAADITITNCTFVGNKSLSNQLGVGGAVHNRGANMTIANSIVWDNGPQGLISQWGNATINFSDVQGSMGGTGFADGGNNINVDPLFFDAAVGDLHLQAGSPCIDSGNFLPQAGWTDFEGDGRIFDGDGDANAVIDRGADEFYPPVAAVTLYEPASGDWVPSGGQYLITWNAPTTAASYKISYTLDGGLTWKSVAKGVTDRSYLWQAPIVTKNKKNCMAKVVGLDTHNGKVGSDLSGKFGIEVLEVTAPAGGTSWNEGSPYDITWETQQTMSPVDKVEISYSVDNGTTWKLIGTTPTGTNPGTYPWPVPTVKKTKTTCKVKVVLKDAGGAVVGSDTSDGTFTIVNVIP
jgi:hypothetical protein